jgi:hypothetical protein
VSAKTASTTVVKGAQISECGRYRYDLLRRWADGDPLLFVMLNPSTADADVDDPTIRRCIGFARREGYGALWVLNLYAYRATDPKSLLTCGDPVGPGNDNMLRAHLRSSVGVGRPIVAAWGANAQADRVEHVLNLCPDADWRCLGTTKDGHPRHPLYVRGDQPLVPFRTAQEPDLSASGATS